MSALPREGRRNRDKRAAVTSPVAIAVETGRGVTADWTPDQETPGGGQRKDGLIRYQWSDDVTVATCMFTLTCTSVAERVPG